MRSAIEITQSILLTACWHGSPCGPDPCICEPIAKAIEATQREAIEAAAKAAADTIRGCDDPDRRTVAHQTTKAILALLPAPAREGE